MKTTVIYAGMFVASMLVATEVVLLLVPHNAEQEAATANPSPATAPVAKAPVRPEPDTTASTRASVAVAPKDTLKRDSVATAGLRDSLSLLHTQLEAERNKVAALNVRETTTAIHPDTMKTTDKKIMAQLLDAMDAQGAAKILRNMDDKDIKEILLAVKKRQAGKILGSLDPERAARIMR